MVSALAGLQRLEAQIYQAMMEAGATQAQSGNANNSATNNQALLKNAEESMAAASQAMNGLDITA